MNSSTSARGGDAPEPGTGGATARPGYNLSKMIRLDEVEHILNDMNARLENQEATIVSLQRLCSSLLPKAAANDAFENMQNTMRDMASRLEDVSAAATANIGTGRDMPAGELAYLNHMNLQNLSKQVEACARQSDVAANLKKLEEDTEAGLNRVRAQSTPAELGETLRRAQKDTSTRVTTTEQTLAQKMDRSEVGNITSLAAALESYAQFRRVTESTLGEQSTINTQVSETLTAHSATLSTAAEERQVLRTQAKYFASLDAMEELAAALRSVTGMTNLCAAKKTVNELHELVISEQHRSTRTEAYAAELQRRLDESDKAIATKASIEDNKKNVLRSHYNEAVQALGADIDTKASSDNLGKTDSRVAVLEAELASESARLAVAMRFIDWFTSRGENYEHNLRLVDKHLGKLTKGSDPRERSPFEGQVRFSSNIMPDEPAARFGGASAANMANRSASHSATNNIGTSFSHQM